MANPVGRPLITTADFGEDWQKRIIDLMQYGASRAEVYAMLDIGDKTFARLMKDDKEFSRTIKRGERLSKSWWENVARTHLKNKDFNSTLWYMNMKNRFGWRDRVDTDITTNGESLSPVLVRFMGDDAGNSKTS